MRKLLITLALVLISWTASSQVSLQFGTRLFQYSGLEAGITFGDRFGIKAIAQCDWYRPGLLSKKSNLDASLGKTYRLMYGGGIVYRFAGNFWLSIDVGYGWKGKYAIDESTGNLGVTDHVEGLDIGADIRWAFAKNWYLSAGYETIPIGFKLKRPVHDFVLGIGVNIPL